MRNLIDYITDVPYARTEAERQKFSVLRLFMFVVSILHSIVFVLIHYFIHMPNFQGRTELIAWFVGQISYSAPWLLLATRFYDWAVRCWALVFSVLVIFTIAAIGTPEILPTLQVVSVIMLIIFSVFLRKNELYVIAALIYASGIIGAQFAHVLNASNFFSYTSEYGFCLAAFELVHQVRTINARSLEQKRIQALQASRLSMLGETLAYLVHEVTTPLTVMRAHLEMLARGDNPQDHIEQMNNALNRAVDFMTSVRRTVRSNQPGRFETVRLSEILKTVSDLVSLTFRRKQIALDFEFAVDVELRCLPAEVAQALIILINNSADAIDDRPERWVRVRCHIEGEYLDIEVSDSGAGIDKAVANKVLEPFYTTKAKGSGIGLSLAQQVASHHGGTLDIVNLHNPTTVRLRLALQPETISPDPYLTPQPFH